MKNNILKFIKEDVLSTVKTTSDLVYKDKIVDAHNVKESYEKLCSETSARHIKSFIKFGNDHYYMNHSAFGRIDKLHARISHETKTSINQEKDGRKKMLQNFRQSEIFNSLWIEGIFSSKKVVSQIIKDFDLREKDVEYSSKFISNYNEAILFVLSTESFNESTFFSLYTILSKDIDMGKEKLDSIPYRLDDVQIGDEKTLGIDPSQIKPSMDTMFELVEMMDEPTLDNATKGKHKGLKMLNIMLLHYHFELIHPYYDMNGRMGRLLSIWLAKKWELTDHVIFLSEAINLFKNDLYYHAFKKSKFQDFKMDATYFISSMSCALISQKIIHLIITSVNESYKNSDGKKLSKLQKDILKSLLSKDVKFFETRDFIIGYDDMNKATVSLALSDLDKLGVIKSTNTKPKQYKLIWNDDMESTLEVYKKEWSKIKKEITK